MLQQLFAIVRRLRFLRRPLGLVCLAIGVLGLLLPILPGWPFLIPAIALLGRRDRSLRHSHLLVRRVLRWLRRTHQPVWLRQLGLRLSLEYLRARRALTPTIIAAERALGLG